MGGSSLDDEVTPSLSGFVLLNRAQCHPDASSRAAKLPEGQCKNGSLSAPLATAALSAVQIGGAIALRRKPRGEAKLRPRCRTVGEALDRAPIRSRASLPRPFNHLTPHCPTPPPCDKRKQAPVSMVLRSSTDGASQQAGPKSGRIGVLRDLSRAFLTRIASWRGRREPNPRMWF